MAKQFTSEEAYQEAQRRIAHAARIQAGELTLMGLGLMKLPPEIGFLTGLQSLSLKSNLLTTLPQEFGSLTSLRRLDLSNNQFITLPPVIGLLVALQVLVIYNNQLTSLPSEIRSLISLEILDLQGENNLTSLPPEIGSLKALKELLANYNQLTALPPEISSLTALQTLDLGHNQFTRLPREIGSLAALQTLKLSGNQLTALPPEISSLTVLQRLDLGQNQFTKLPWEVGSLISLQTLDLSDNKLSTLSSEISSLTELQTLDLRDNKLTTLSPKIGSLAALQTLDLSNNKLSSLPPELGLLSALEELFLDYNQLSNLPQELSGLVKLRELHAHSIGLESLDRSLLELQSLRYLILHGNAKLGLSPSVLGPNPKTFGWNDEQKQKCPTARSILDVYFGRLSGDSRPLNEVKLILVGRGGAGKTSVVRALKGLPFRKDEVSTPGIALSDWKLKGCDGGDVTAHVWDFAGQVVTHALHQFFFSVRSVYVLVLTGRENSERADAEYWLRLIRAFGTEVDGSGPPVIVALNKWNVKGCRPKLDRGVLLERYPFIRGFVEVDCMTALGVDEMRERIMQEVAKLKWVREPFKASWDAVRRELARKKKESSYLSFDQYREICRTNDVAEMKEQESLAEVLHNLGAALNYRNDPRLREATVLQPAWLTKNVYAIVRRAEKSLGVLKKTDVDAALARIADPKMWDYLVRLMERFEIAYSPKKGTTGPWAVPQALPDEQPTGAAAFSSASDATRLRYTYQALPEGLVARAIVRLHEFIEEVEDERQQWASGAILVREGARALIRTEPEDRQVWITITGETNARRQLAGLCQTEMRDIHDDIRGLNPLEETQFDGAWINIATLEKDEASGKQTGIPTREHGTVPANPADANDAFSKPAARRIEVWKPTAFICYSKVDIRKRERLERELKVLANEGLLEKHWHDRMIDPGDTWDSKIQEELIRADIAIVLLSSASLSTDYITKHEIPNALKMRDEGKMVVIPLILEACRWDKTLLGDLQAIPEKGRPIDRWTPQSTAWKSVSDGLGKICAKMINDVRKV